MEKYLVFTLLFLMVIGPIASSRRSKHPYEINVDDLDDDIEKYKWKRSESNSHSDCLGAYIKIVKFLLRKERYVQLDENGSDDGYHAMLNLKLSREQFQLIEDGIDGLNVNEIDQLLNEVVSQSGEMETTKIKNVIFDYYVREFKQLVSSVLDGHLFVLIISILLFLILAYCKCYINFNKITFSAVFITTLFTIFIISFTFEYLECSNDLEVKELVKQTTKNFGINPCEQFIKEKQNSYSLFYTKIFGSSEDACYLHMEKVLKPSQKYCDPAIVFTKWMGKLHMSYFETLLNSFIKILNENTGSSNIFSKIIIWLGGGFIFIFLIVSFGKEIITNVFKFILKLMATRISTETNQTGNNDNLYLENQLLKQEVRLLRENSVERSLPQQPREKILIDSKSTLPCIEEN